MGVVPTVKPVIFISHASEDKEIAILIKEAIQNRHRHAFKVFNASDTESIQAADEWKKKIEKAIKESSLMLALLTEKSNSRPWIYWECGGAYYRKTPVMPLVGPGLKISELEALFPDLQAVELLTADGLSRMMTRIDRLSKGPVKQIFNADVLLSQLKEQFDSQKLIGKNWLEKAIPRIQDFLRSIESGQEATIRIISYTDETTSDKLPAEILQHLKPESILNLKILLRSEYSGFTSRPLHPKYNRRVRWRISRFKARWYRCAKKLKAMNPQNTLSIRGYDFDPMPKSLILGETAGYFGLYAIDRNHRLSDYPLIDPAPDWVASNTSMAYIDRNQMSFLTSQIKWFDEMWDQANQRSNEEYRCERFDSLWHLLNQKYDADAQVQEVVNELSRTGEEGGFPDIGNLAIPMSRPETPEPVVDIIACAVFKRRTNKCAIICEIRNPADLWEGIGKTETYLKLIGLAPSILRDEFSIRAGKWDEELLRHIRESEFQWGEDEKYDFELLASDFVWTSVDEGKLTVCPPEGEPVIGLWDVSRHVLRRIADRTGHWQDGIQRVLPQHQELLFSKMTLNRLAKRYRSTTAPIVPSLIVVLEKTNGSTNPKASVIKSPVIIRGLLMQVLQSGPNHRSPFWMREPDEIRRLRDVATDLVKSLNDKTLPKLVLVTGSPPFGSLSPTVRRHL